MQSNEAVAKYGFIGATGLLVAAWAAHTYIWYGYQRANPAVGSVSTGTGFELFVAGLFVFGVTVAFTAFSQGLAHALGIERSD
jgi:hypothetical protein